MKILLILFSISYFAFSEPWPPIESANQRLRLYLYLNNEMPELMEKIPIGEALGILEQQKELLEKIKEEKVGKFLDRKDPFLKLTVEDIVERSVVSKTIDPAVLIQWKNDLSKTASGIPEDTFEEGIQGSLKNKLSQLGQKRSQNILTGLKRQLPKNC